MFSKISNAAPKLFAFYQEEEEGQALAEYGLIPGFIAVVAIAALTLLGTGITGQLGSINSAIGDSSST